MSDSNGSSAAMSRAGLFRLVLVLLAAGLVEGAIAMRVHPSTSPLEAALTGAEALCCVAAAIFIAAACCPLFPGGIWLAVELTAAAAGCHAVWGVTRAVGALPEASGTLQALGGGLLVFAMLGELTLLSGHQEVLEQ